MIVSEHSNIGIDIWLIAMMMMATATVSVKNFNLLNIS